MEGHPLFDLRMVGGGGSHPLFDLRMVGGGGEKVTLFLICGWWVVGGWGGGSPSF